MTATREALVEVRDLVREFRLPRVSLRTPPPVVRALRGVSFDLYDGDRLGIVGESGSGKSTLARLMLAIDQPTSGQVRFRGQRVSGRRERELGFLRRGMQLVFQDPMGSLDPRMRVRDIVLEPLRGTGQTAGGRDRVTELLEAVDLGAEAADRYPHQFSGGQRQRIAIARALAPRPGVLVADEAVSALDVSVRAQVLNLLLDLTERFDLTLVFIAHDLSVVRHLCDRVLVMRDGEVVEAGPTEQVYAAPRHEYTAALLAAVPVLRR